LTKEKRTLEDLIKFLNDSNESDKKTIISLFNLLNLLSNNISNIEELIEFLNKKIGGKSRIIKKLLKLYKY
jgi:predicted transcriptional regulator